MKIFIFLPLLALAAMARAAAPTEDAAALLARARNLAGTGKFAEALPLFTQLTELEPANYRGHSRRAAMLNYLDRYSEGLAAIERAVALAPDNAMLYFNRGLSLSEVGRFAEAVADFEKASAGRPELPMPHADRASARMSLGQLDAALRDCDSAIQAEANYIWSRYYRAQIRYLQGDFNSAAADFAAVAENQPEFPAARLWRDVSQHRAGKNAGPAFVASATDSGWPTPLLAHLRGDLTADDLLDKARELRVADDERRLSAAHAVIGLGHLFAGRTAEANAAFTRALEFKVPDHFERLLARAELARLP